MFTRNHFVIIASSSLLALALAGCDNNEKSPAPAAATPPPKPAPTASNTPATTPPAAASANNTPPPAETPAASTPPAATPPAATPPATPPPAAAPVVELTGAEKEAADAAATLKSQDAGLDRFFKDSAGYAVFPSIKKGGLGIGAAAGDGIVFAKGGTPVGTTSMTQASIGLQVGGQAFTEIIFFQDDASLNKFKEGKFEFAAQASAVAVKSGAAANADYRDGVAIFTGNAEGLMAEAAVGGQKFTYKAK